MSAPVNTAEIARSGAANERVRTMIYGFAD